MRPGWLASLLVCAVSAGLPAAASETSGVEREAASTQEAEAGRPQRASSDAWEVNGIRLERDQVERLADDMAERTVEAVLRKVEGIALREAQIDAMRGIYREVSLDVFDQVVSVIDQPDLSDREKDDRVRELVLAGQRRSHDRLEGVLDAGQMQRYSAWEQTQIDAYRSPRWRERRSRRRR